MCDRESNLECKSQRVRAMASGKCGDTFQAQCRQYLVETLNTVYLKAYTVFASLETKSTCNISMPAASTEDVEPISGLFCGGPLCLFWYNRRKYDRESLESESGWQGPKAGYWYQIPGSKCKQYPKLLGTKNPEDHEDQSLSVKPVAASAFPYLLSASVLTAH